MDRQEEHLTVTRRDMSRSVTSSRGSVTGGSPLKGGVPLCHSLNAPARKTERGVRVLTGLPSGGIVAPRDLATVNLGLT